jgi:subtilase family serine protease
MLWYSTSMHFQTITSTLIRKIRQLLMMNNSSLISAEVILKSKSGRSVYSRDVAITSKNVKEFQPTEVTINDVSNRLQKLGFTVLKGGITLTVIAEPTLFEKVFKVKLTLKKNEKASNIVVNPDEELVIPDSLSNSVEKIVFVPSPEFYARH